MWYLIVLIPDLCLLIFCQVLILLAAGWFIEVAVLCIDSEKDWKCSDWPSYAGGALINVDDSAGLTVYMKFVRNPVTNDLCSSNECFFCLI